jgi:hypothetical protein
VGRTSCEDLCGSIALRLVRFWFRQTALLLESALRSDSRNAPVLLCAPMSNHALPRIAALLGIVACGGSRSSSQNEMTNDSSDKHSAPRFKEAALKSDSALKPDAAAPDSREEQAIEEMEEIVDAFAYFNADTGKDCPDNLAELDRYRSNKTKKDPWGNDLVIHCGLGPPNGFGVLSVGPDGARGSSDDIKSW